MLVGDKTLKRRQQLGDRNERGECGEEVLAESGSVRDAVDVAALRAEVWVGEVVEDHEADEEGGQDDGERYQDEAELLGAVPLAEGDVGHEDKGGEKTKYEATDLGEVVDIGDGS